jgi:hypothetical protein
MATITGLTADRMLEIEAASIVDGSIDATGHLILTTKGGTNIDAGYFGFSAQSITTPTDFNTLTQPGSYVFLVSTDVAASANAPTADAFGFTSGKSGILLVEGNSNWIRQTWTNYNNAQDTLVRVKTNNWYAWAPANKAATATSQGIIETATAAEVTAQTDDTRAVTPLGLASLKGYRFLQTVVFTASGTFTKASYPGLRAVRIRAVGGGGGGGRANSAATGNHSSGSGGGGGGYAESFVLAASLGTTETVTIGAGGAGGTSVTGQGGDGGNTSFGTKAVAGGGGGGGIASNQNLTVVANPLGAAGVATTGDVKASGSPGGAGWGSATLGIGGNGGNSVLGGGGYGGSGPGGAATMYGGDGLAYGGGGGGAATNASGSGGNGAPGAPGVVIVEVYV